MFYEVGKIDNFIYVLLNLYIFTQYKI